MRKAETKAQEMGFDSVVDMLTKFVLKISTNKPRKEDVTQLSKKAISRYDRMEEDIKNGKNTYKFENVDDALEFLIHDER